MTRLLFWAKLLSPTNPNRFGQDKSNQLKGRDQLIAFLQTYNQDR